ncbi:MAG TPA: LuxR C-terminal-related transcriptional regulator [Actinomycetota bacterium]|nr:LuxR C-terminal-related transcriptional regulator [Actinomycetota bacterium]
MRPVRVAVVDEHEIFRRGIVTCLADDPTIVVVADVPAGPLTEDADVVVVSPAVTGDLPELPLVVCGDHDGMRLDAPAGLVMAVLPRSTLTPDRLIGAVRAAAAGLRIGSDRAEPDAGRLDRRRLEVLRLLAEGADTMQISRELSYSERTIKSLIQDVERELGARSRAQAVARGIREGLI